MGQAFDENGDRLGEAFGDSKEEVLKKLQERFDNPHEVRIKRLTESDNLVVPAEAIALADALVEWRDAGADVLTVVHAIQRFVYALQDK